MGRLNYANALKQYFRDNFTYSIFPGASPYGRDAIEYFLTEQKRGYCVHFAASAALLLRSAGIPTRYVEGYVINPADIQQGRTESESMKEWVVTQDASASDTVAVSQVEIPDANAHAWIEIYLDGYGWIPFEMTPPSDGEDISDLRFADFLAGLFNPTRRAFGYDDSANSVDAGVIASPKRNILSKTLGSAEFLLEPLLFAVIFITAVILIIYAAGWAKRALNIRYLLKNGGYGEALLVMYRELVSAMKKERLIEASNPTTEQVSKAAGAKLGVSFEQAAKAVKQAAFSQKGISYEDYEAAYSVFTECKRIIKENKKRRKTIR